MNETAWKMEAHEPHLDQGYVHVYTGNGKGKTTAALGLALRAAGSGLQVAVAMFMKNGQSGEFRMLKRLNAGIRVFDYGSGCFIHGKPDGRETLRAQRGYHAIEKVLAGEEVIIGKAGKPVARLVKYEESRNVRRQRGHP
jgi:cob(I)alamin adenosyltransferase